jgi:hypothetical protein
LWHQLRRCHHHLLGGVELAGCLSLRHATQGKGLVSSEELKLWLVAEGLPESQALQRLLVFAGGSSLPSYIPLQVRDPPHPTHAPLPLGLLSSAE